MLPWTHIILEAYCARKWSEKKDKYRHRVIDLDKLKTRRIPNPDYNHNYKTPKKPVYCPNLPQYLCLKKNCPHLAYADALKQDYLFLGKRYRK